MKHDPSEESMGEIVRTVARWLKGFILVYGIYVVLYGHVTPGGGFGQRPETLDDRGIHAALHAFVPKSEMGLGRGLVSAIRKPEIEHVIRIEFCVGHGSRTVFNHPNPTSLRDTSNKT